MNTDTDFDRIAQTWLQDGPSEMPDRSLQAALDEVHVTTQRRFGAARRVIPMNGNIWRVAAAAVIGILIIVGGLAFLGGRQGGVGSAPATASPTPSPQATPARLPDQGPVAGTYLMSDGRSSFRISIPPGWESQSYGRDIRKHRDQLNEVTFGIYSPDLNVFQDACATEDVPPRSIGPTTDDLVAALNAQQNSEVSEPAEVTIGGRSAMRLDISIPDGLDVAGCTDGVLKIWVDGDESYLAGLGPTGTAPVTIVETSSGRMVIYTGSESEATAPDLAELQAIIDSIQFEPAP
jgi:hypothetical protein